MIFMYCQGYQHEIPMYMWGHGLKHGDQDLIHKGDTSKKPCPSSVLVHMSNTLFTGDSSGGNLAASLALRLRDEKMTSQQPKLQVLIYPALQAFNFNTPSYQRHQYDTMLPKRQMVKFWNAYANGNFDLQHIMAQNKHTSHEIKYMMSNSYLNVQNIDTKYIYKDFTTVSEAEANDDQIWAEYKHIFLNGYFAPLLVNDIKNLPATYMITAEYDILRDDGLLYKHRLEEAGNAVTHVHYMTGMHGMLSFLSLFDDSRQVLHDMVNFIQHNV